MIESFFNAFTDFFNWISSFFSGFFDLFFDVLNSVFSGFLDFIQSGVDIFLYVLVGIVGVLIAYFGFPYIKLFVKDVILVHLKGFLLIIFIVFVLNLAGTLVAFTLYHLYMALVLALSPFVTSFTTNLISLGFTGLLLLTVGVIGYKVFSK